MAYRHHRDEVIDKITVGGTINTVVLGSAGAYGIRTETVESIHENHVTTRLGTVFNLFTGREVGPIYPDPFRVIVDDRDAAIYRSNV